MQVVHEKDIDLRNEDTLLRILLHLNIMHRLVLHFAYVALPTT
jgi:hypothetical protein